MRVQIINDNKVDSREVPTETVCLVETKLYIKSFLNPDRPHYASEWYCEIHPSELPSLVDKLRGNDGYVDFIANGDEEATIWIKTEEE